MKNSFFWAVSNGLILSVSAFAHKGATGIVKERMDNFKASQMALKPILAVSKRNDFEAIVPLANQIKNWAEIMPTKFPSGSDGTPSEASPAIWTDFEGLKSAVKENFGAARFLEVTALNGDTKATAKAIKQLAGTCRIIKVIDLTYLLWVERSSLNDKSSPVYGKLIRSSGFSCISDTFNSCWYSAI